MNLFEKTVTNTWGEPGKIWLNNLPTIISSLTKYWSLSNLKPVTNMRYNYVALATQNHTTPVVLKISCDKKLIEEEFKALNHFDGRGSIQLIDRNQSENAILLQQAIPGYLLKDHHPTNIEETITIYAEVVQALATHPILNEQYTHVSQWCKAIDRIKNNRIEKHLVDKAQQVRAFLLKSSAAEHLCHGDLHLENIIQHGTNWLAIDPKGIMGEVAFEAAAFDLISNKDWSKPEKISDLILTRINLLANKLQIDSVRLLYWVFLRVMISAQWFIEDNGDPDEMLRLASIIYPLIKHHANKST